MIGLLLNIITLIIVGLFVFFIYISYRQRPDITTRPIDVMRDIVGGQAGHSRIYKVLPDKRLLYGPVGTFGNYSEVDYSRLEGNMFPYNEGTKPWEGVKDANFGSYSGVSQTELSGINEAMDQPDSTKRRQEILAIALANTGDANKTRDIELLNVNDPDFYEKLANIQNK